MIVEAAVVGVLAGIVSGMLGVGGGSLFVPALVLLVGLSHLEAEATSLLAIVPTALVGVWRQRGYGNVRGRESLALGLLGVAGGVLGVVIANWLPERALEIGFAVLLLFVASQLLRRALRPVP